MSNGIWCCLIFSAGCQHQVNQRILIAQFTGRLPSLNVLFPSILAALCSRWGQIRFWAQCEQTSLWGFDNRFAADYRYHPWVSVATCLWVRTRRKDMDFLPRCEGQELFHRVLQHSNTRPNQVFLCSSHTASPPPTWHLFFSSDDLFTSFSISLLHSSSLGWELVNLWFPQQRALFKE